MGRLGGWIELVLLNACPAREEYTSGQVATTTATAPDSAGVAGRVEHLVRGRSDRRQHPSRLLRRLVVIHGDSRGPPALPRPGMAAGGRPNRGVRADSSLHSLAKERARASSQERAD